MHEHGCTLEIRLVPRARIPAESLTTCGALKKVRRACGFVLRLIGKRILLGIESSCKKYFNSCSEYEHDEVDDDVSEREWY